MSRKKKLQKVAVFDFETDPFLYGRNPLPFCAGFFDGVKYADFWNTDSGDREKDARALVMELADYLADLKEPHLVYAHNGGKFDFYYLLRAGLLENPVKIINGRIVSAKIGIHELRDSYAIIPIPLAAYQKDTIDYDLFEVDKRQANKADILHYLAKDCEYLYQLVSAFNSRFGDKLTIGGTAMQKLKELHPFERTTEAHDLKLRPFYYGGRVQAFETGIIRGDFKIFDVNSMYPYVMREIFHPLGAHYITYYENVLDERGELIDGESCAPYFARITARNRGALPTRTKEGLSFDLECGEFFATSHEIKIGLKHKLIEIDRVHEVLVPMQKQTFDKYVDSYIKEKIEGKESGDKVKEIFAKLLLNSAYGKFGQNPDNYFDFRLCENIEIDYWHRQGWELEADYGEFAIMRTPSENKSYFDVAVAASVTGAARAVLLDALNSAVRPVYCDTDSIICEALPGVEIDALKLGAWDLEKRGDMVAIAGKKLYALFDGTQCLKVASKGVRLKGHDIAHICAGQEKTHFNDAPSFGLDGSIKYMKRRINTTVKNKAAEIGANC